MSRGLAYMATDVPSHRPTSDQPREVPPWQMMPTTTPQAARALFAAARSSPASPGTAAGRPKGARTRLGEAFLDDLRALWERDGAAVLEEARREKPMEFARTVAGLFPKELLARSAPGEAMTDDEFADTIEALRAVARRH